eukprot:UN24587
MWVGVFVRQISECRRTITNEIFMICSFGNFCAFCLVFMLKHAKNVVVFRIFCFVIVSKE